MIIHLAESSSGPGFTLTTTEIGRTPFFRRFIIVLFHFFKDILASENVTTTEIGRTPFLRMFVLDVWY